MLKVLAVLVAVWLLKFLGGTHLTYNKSMFKKTIAVLLVFSIVLSSCGKKDKSNDFVRTATVESQESQESQESSESPEIRDPVKSLTPFESRVSATCDGFALCRYVRHSTFWHYYTYDMFHIYDVPVTPNRVVCALVAVYLSCKSFKFVKSQVYSFLEKREEKIRVERKFNRMKRMEKDYSSLTPVPVETSTTTTPAPAPVETPLTPICEDEEIWKEWFVSQPPRFVPAHLANSIFAQPDVQFNSVRAKFVARYGSTLPSSVPLSHPALIPAPAEPPPALVTSVDSTVMVRDIGVNTFESILRPSLLPSPMFGNSVDLCEYSLVVRSKSEHIETRSVRLDVQPDLIPSDGANQLKMYKNSFLVNGPSYEMDWKHKEFIKHAPSPPLVLGNEEKLESIENMNKRRGISSSVVNIPSEHYPPPPP